jgi:hypothetical protein
MPEEAESPGRKRRLGMAPARSALRRLPLRANIDEMLRVCGFCQVRGHPDCAAVNTDVVGDRATCRITWMRLRPH